MHSRLPLIKINYKYIINFIFKPVSRNLMPVKGEGYDEYHLTETTSYTVAFYSGVSPECSYHRGRPVGWFHPAVAGAGFSALTLAILLGMVLGNTIYPHIWKAVTVVCCLPSNIYYVWVSFFMASV